MEMHHASKMLLKLFTLFHPCQLSSEHTYAHLLPAEGAGARCFAPALPSPLQSHGLAPHGRWIMERCFPSNTCTAGTAVAICNVPVSPTASRSCSYREAHQPLQRSS